MNGIFAVAPDIDILKNCAPLKPGVTPLTAPTPADITPSKLVFANEAPEITGEINVPEVTESDAPEANVTVPVITSPEVVVPKTLLP